MNRKQHPVEGSLPQKPYLLSPLLASPSFLKWDAFCPHHGGQRSYTVELAKARAEVATISGKRPLLTIGRPLHWSCFLRVWARSRYAVYILGGSVCVCAPKTFNVSLLQAFKAFPWHLRWQLRKGDSKCFSAEPEKAQGSKSQCS